MDNSFQDAMKIRERDKLISPGAETVGECLALLPLLGQKGANKRRRGKKGEKEDEEEKGDGRGSFINLTGDERTGELLDERTQKKVSHKFSLESFVLPNSLIFTPFFQGGIANIWTTVSDLMMVTVHQAMGPGGTKQIVHHEKSICGVRKRLEIEEAAFSP